MKRQLLLVLFIAAFAWANADVVQAEGGGGEEEEETGLSSLEKDEGDLTEFLNGVELDVAAVSSTSLIFFLVTLSQFAHLRMSQIFELDVSVKNINL